MNTSHRLRAILSVLLITLLAFPSQVVLAWKPYTHNYTGSQVLADVLSDGRVTINGREYTVRAAIVDALDKCPQFYNAGVVGPDGFPDLAYGQSIIHPEDTGKWLRHIYTRAWQAQTQSGGACSADEKSQILAFTYGYLTHAAGDMWGHTFVNDFARGVFPAVSDILTSVDDAEIALRHIIVEGYVGDATPGFDGNPDRSTLPDGDVSDDSTPEIPYNAPHRFIYETLVNPQAMTPGCGDGVDDDEDGVADDGCPGAPGKAGDKAELKRGPIIDFFLDLRAALVAEVSDAPGPLQQLLDRLTNTQALQMPAGCNNADDNDGDGSVNDGCPSVGLFNGEAGADCANASDDDGDGAVNDGCPQVGGNSEGDSGPCSFGAGLIGPLNIAFDIGADLFNCPPALVELGFEIAGEIDSPEEFIDFIVAAVNDLLDGLFDAYLAAWIADIDEGLQHWSELGMASTNALFDPQARRNLQNDECANEGPDTVDNLLRANCEDGIGIVDVLLNEVDNIDTPLHNNPPISFINDHLISMLGAPDFVGGLRDALDTLSAALDEILGPIGAVFNPLELALTDIKEFAKQKVKELIKERYGIDVDALKDFLTSPTHWLNVESAQITLPVLGTVTVEFFRASDHARLDAIMGLTGTHHVASDLPFPGESTRLSDSAVYDPAFFAPLKNTITMGKLLLLDGSELNRLLNDMLVDRGLLSAPGKVQTYQDGLDLPANIMIDSLPASDCVVGSAMGGGVGRSVGGVSDAAANLHTVYLPLVSHTPSGEAAAQQALAECDPWLLSIDSDHAWRADGLPVFYNNAAQLPYTRTVPPAIFRPAELNGGNGHFPIWESCLLRPTFRGIFTDWENGAQNFPDLGDGGSADPSDPSPPVSTLTVAGTVFISGSTTYVGADHVFTLSATDNVFAAGALGLQYRLYKDGVSPGDWLSLPPSGGGTFSIPANAGDGIWHVDFRAEDPCHTFSPDDALPPEATHTQTYILDTTAPTIAITSPAENAVFDTDDFSNIQYSANDGSLGSGIASHSVAFDGAPAVNGQVLDMFFLMPGVHTLVVTAADNLGNTRTLTRTFEVHATAESLSNNLDRALSLGLISKNGIYNSLKQKVEAALRAHNRGQHPVEHNVLGAFVNELKAQDGKAVDLETANRFIAYALDLIARGG